MTHFDRFIRFAFILAVAVAIIASFTVRAHAAIVTPQAPPCLKAPLHHKRQSVPLPVQTCATPLTPPCFTLDDIPQAVATPHPTYIVLEYPADTPDASPTVAGAPSGVETIGEGSGIGRRDVAAPRGSEARMSAPEMDPTGAPAAIALLAMLAAIAAGRRSC